MSHLVEKMLAIHDGLAAADLPHGFGGAIALAYCIEEPRGTRDLDLNIFIQPSDAELAFRSLPSAIEIESDGVESVKREGQVRAWWDGTPIDLFFNSLPLHELVANRLVWVPLGDHMIPVIDCVSLVVFKALVDRKKDWVDIEAIAEASSEAIAIAAETLTELAPGQDPRVGQLRALLGREGREKEDPSLKKILEGKGFRSGSVRR